MKTSKRGLALTVAVLLSGGLASSLSAQFPGNPSGPKRIVKETLEDGSLVLDESGLTRGFAAMKRMLRYVDTESIDGKEVEVHSGRLPLMGIDWESFKKLDSGIVQFRAFAAIKMKTAAELRFGDVSIKPGNVSPDYPGLYSLWIRKVSDDDWRLIFNHDADSWGTMHDPSRDVGEVRLTHETEEGANPSFMIELEPNESGGGLLRLGWGDHKWSVPYTTS